MKTKPINYSKSSTDRVTIGGHSDATGHMARATSAILKAKPVIPGKAKAFAASSSRGGGLKNC